MHHTAYCASAFRRLYNTGMPYVTTREQFEALVEKAIRNIPRRYRRYFTNISIIVEDMPDPETARSVEVPRDALLGLFSGVPYTEKDSFFGIPHPLPDAIFLYQKNIERICRNETDLVEEIRKTLVHEVGHYFGFSEEDLLHYE